MQMPYAVTSCEDTMYLNQQNIVTLEYHLFQNDCKYVELSEIDKEKEDIFGLKNFNSNDKTLSQFHDQDHQVVCYKEADKPIVFAGNDLFSTVHEHSMIDRTNHDDIKNLLKKNLQSLTLRTKRGKKIPVKKEKTTHCLGVIALYKVTPSGTMKRIDEVNIEMGRNFYESHNGNMTLTRSYGKHLISLCNFD